MHSIRLKVLSGVINILEVITHLLREPIYLKPLKETIAAMDVKIHLTWFQTAALEILIFELTRLSTL